MNRRNFCKSLAMVPVAAVAVSIGVPEAGHVIDTGSNVKLQFPKLYPLIHKGNQTGRWSSGCLYSYQRDVLR